MKTTNLLIFLTDGFFDGMKTTNLLIFLTDGDLCVNQRQIVLRFLLQDFRQFSSVRFNMSHDSLDLILCNSQVGVDLLLVNFVSLGKREHGDETKDHKGESVEPGADVSHHPEEDAEFDGIDHVFNED